MSSNHRKTTHCTVCGFTEVRTDEVFHGGSMLLAECPRCDHRWTQRTERMPRIIPVRTAGTPLDFEVEVAA